MPDDDDGDMTMSEQELQERTLLSMEEYLALDEEVERESEVVEGHLVAREPRERPHQKTAFRLANGFEVAVLKYRSAHAGSRGAPCYEINTEVPVRLWDVPLTIRKPDAIVHRCREQFETLEAADAVIVTEVVSRWSQSRDRIHKMGEYAKALIPHYLIVQFDELGATIVEHYALMGTDTSYFKIGITHRDRDIWALNLTTPFEIQVGWPDLAIALPA
ncbi:Uma2 family endonuclease [Spirillospora sp. NPDC048819]|uniref:Uma2 family endonuclease n=1 Tax=Spirillospora sp. NPDC048819 TaxID=3155268 RepID=UPI0033BFFA47